MSQPSEKVQPTANPSSEQLRMPSGSVPGVGNMGVSTTSAGPSLDPDTLRKTAEAATPGPWRIDKDSEQDYEQGIPYSEWPQTLVGPKNTQASQWAIDHGEEFMVDEISELSWPDAEHIASFDPPTVLALLSRLEQAEQAVERKQQALGTLARIIETQQDAVMLATDSQDLIGEDGDGDWDAVWDRVAELGEGKRRSEQAVARVRALCMSTDGDYLDNEETVNTVGDILEALDGDTRG